MDSGLSDVCSSVDIATAWSPSVTGSVVARERKCLRWATLFSADNYGTAVFTGGESSVSNTLKTGSFFRFGKLQRSTVNQELLWGRRKRRAHFLLVFN